MMLHSLLSVLVALEDRSSACHLDCTFLTRWGVDAERQPYLFGMLGLRTGFLVFFFGEFPYVSLGAACFLTKTVSRSSLGCFGVCFLAKP